MGEKRVLTHMPPLNRAQSNSSGKLGEKPEEDGAEPEPGKSFIGIYTFLYLNIPWAEEGDGEGGGK